jgi:hypothetical protein
MESFTFYIFPLISCSSLLAFDLTSSTAQTKPTERRLVALVVNIESEKMWNDGVADKHRHLPDRKTKRTNYLVPG